MWLNGNFFFLYKAGTADFYNINEKNYGPYDEIDLYDRFFEMNENGNFAFSYQLNEEHYINCNGTVHEPYDRIVSYIITW